ncbi:MAG: tetratricopeptide repeat protein [Pelagibacterales bacterium]|nr:tetratricopeptide repeat protein [Pelagibacterales bacterium]
MESELKKAVNLYEKGQLNSAKKIALHIYNSKPHHFDNLRLLNLICFKKKDFSSALDFINKAIKINPNFAEAYNEQGNALTELKQLQLAIKSYDQAIKLNPKYTDAYYNKGLVLHELKRIELAIENYDQAIKINPNHVYSHNNKGYALQKLKKIEASIESFYNVLKINPNFDFLLGELVHAKNKLCDWNSFNKDLETLKNKINEKKKSSTPFPVLQLYDSPSLQKNTAEIYVKEKFYKEKILNPISIVKKNKKIRLGYYSADFYNHAMSYLLAGLFKQHDKSKFELFAFSFGPEKNDEMSKKIPNYFNDFVKVNFKTDKEIAEISRNLKIDIAIDLLCFTTNNRMGIFSERCAPIQVNYLGYPGTSGANFIDYIIADKILIPKESQKYYSEKIIYLPNTYQARDSSLKISDKIFKREELGLPKNAFVFCCFNQNNKITPNIFDIWMRILKTVDKSVLWLLEDNSIATKNLRKEAKKRKIDPKRIIFAKRMSMTNHFARHKCADLFLDTFPYGAHTTCSDSLWAGLPIVTLMGKSFASRVAGSLLNAINLEELITTTEKEYEKLIIELANNSYRLKEIRNKLHKNKSTKPLFDTKLYTKNIELAYTKTYEKYLNKLPAKNIDI